MITLKVRNVNHALPRALAMLRDDGKRIAPRGQPTLEMSEPVATCYTCPEEMVLFDQQRDANPFFHFFEALWILAGRRDVEFLAHFNKRMADYSDDGSTFHAPYGYRLREGFGFDQIETAIEKLAQSPDTRQVVLSIWDPAQDYLPSKDIPCNDMLMFKVRDGELRMLVANRSNDAVWGAYGANVVQFSTLQVYMARRLGVPVGTYTQVSDSFHVYDDNPFWDWWVDTHKYGTPPVYDPYSEDELLLAQFDPAQMMFMQTHELRCGSFDADLTSFFTQWENGQADVFSKYETISFIDTVMPMYRAFKSWKRGDREGAMELSKFIRAADWRIAVEMWLARRVKRVKLDETKQPV